MVYNIIILLNMRGKVMTIDEQIKVLCVRSNISAAELARKMGQSPQNLNSKMKRGSLTIADLEEIGNAVNAKFERYFTLPNGDKV